MAELIISLVPLAMAAALQPPQLIALVVLMQTSRGVVNGWAYFGGMVAFRLTLAGVFWLLLSSIEENIEAAGGRFDIFVGAVLLILGILLLVFALRRAFSARDEDEIAASWLQKLEAASPAQAALIGVAFLALDPKDWLVDITAVDLIAAADLRGPASLVTYMVYILLAQSILLIPLSLAFANAEKAAALLDRVRVWLDRHERVIVAGVGLLFGGYFLFAGWNRLRG